MVFSALKNFTKVATLTASGRFFSNIQTTCCTYQNLCMSSMWDEYSDIWIYLNIFRRIYSFVQVFVNFFQGEYIQIFIRHLFMLTNIFGYSFVRYLWYWILLNFHCFPKMVENCYYWSKMVQYGSKITQNMKIDKIVQNNLGKIIWYLNTFEYFGQIYSFAKIFVDFFIGKFIWIFIRDIFIMPNIFGY